MIEKTNIAGLERAMAARAAGGLDVHTARAAELFGVPPESVTRKQREAAKLRNYMDAYSYAERGRDA